jgi:outer membrane lipoprotein carrier protein
MPPFTSFCTIVTLLAFSGGLATQATPSPQDLANSLQKKYDTIRDFTTDFVHTYEGGVLRRKREERGTLLVKKPGKMRWNYKAPDEKVFVADGVRLIQYLPEENRAIVSGMPDEDQPAFLFLSGRGSLTRDFNVSLGQGGPPDAWVLRLEPKKPQQEYDWLEIVAARDTFMLRSLTVAEKQGNRSTFTFSNFKENPGLADKTFAFSIPRGAEVQNAGPAKR